MSGFVRFCPFFIRLRRVILGFENCAQVFNGLILLLTIKFCIMKKIKELKEFEINKIDLGALKGGVMQEPRDTLSPTAFSDGTWDPNDVVDDDI